MAAGGRAEMRSFVASTLLVLGFAWFCWFVTRALWRWALGMRKSNAAPRRGDSIEDVASDVANASKVAGAFAGVLALIAAPAGLMAFAVSIGLVASPLPYRMLQLSLRSRAPALPARLRRGCTRQRASAVHLEWPDFQLQGDRSLSL